MSVPVVIFTSTYNGSNTWLLEWNVTENTDLELDGQVITNSIGSKVIATSTSKTMILKAIWNNPTPNEKFPSTDAQNQQITEQSITIDTEDFIQSFSIDLEKVKVGEEVKIQWDIITATSFFLNDIVISKRGYDTFRVDYNTTFEIKAIVEGKTQTKTLEVEVYSDETDELLEEEPTLVNGNYVQEYDNDYLDATDEELLENAKLETINTTIDYNAKVDRDYEKNVVNNHYKSHVDNLDSITHTHVNRFVFFIKTVSLYTKIFILPKTQALASGSQAIIIAGLYSVLSGVSIVLRPFLSSEIGIAKVASFYRDWEYAAVKRVRASHFKLKANDYKQKTFRNRILTFKSKHVVVDESNELDEMNKCVEHAESTAGHLQMNLAHVAAQYGDHSTGHRLIDDVIAEFESIHDETRRITCDIDQETGQFKLDVHANMSLENDKSAIVHQRVFRIDEEAEISESEAEFMDRINNLGDSIMNHFDEEIIAMSPSPMKRRRA